VTYVSEKGSVTGGLCTARRSWCPHLAFGTAVPFSPSRAAAARPLRQLLQDGVETSNHVRWPTLHASRHSTIYWAHYFAPSVHKMALFYGEAVRAHLAISSGITFCRSGFGPCDVAVERESRYANFRSSSATNSTCVISYIRFVLVTRASVKAVVFENSQPISEMPTPRLWRTILISIHFRPSLGHTPTPLLRSCLSRVQRR